MTNDIVARLHLALVQALRNRGPDALDRPVTVAEIYQDLIPYRVARAVAGVELNADYEHALLRLFAGEGGRVRLEPATAREELLRELDSPNPNVSLYRKFAACDAWITVPPELGRQPQASPASGAESNARPAASAGSPAASAFPPLRRILGCAGYGSRRGGRGLGPARDRARRRAGRLPDRAGLEPAAGRRRAPEAGRRRPVGIRVACLGLVLPAALMRPGPPRRPGRRGEGPRAGLTCPTAAPSAGRRPRPARTLARRASRACPYCGTDQSRFRVHAVAKCWRSAGGSASSVVRRSARRCGPVLPDRRGHPTGRRALVRRAARARSRAPRVSDG